METYLDYNATSPIDPAVFEAMEPYLKEHFANASSFHQKGQSARNAVEEAREHLADSLSVESGDLFFTSGGTESDNLAIKGALAAQEQKGRKQLLVSAFEHQAVLHPAQMLAKSGFDLKLIPVSHEGMVDVDFIRSQITDKTALVSVMHVNNEVGTIQPVKEIAGLCQKAGALFHVDAVQSFGKMSVKPADWGVDLLTISAHKICGPKGAGALYIRKGVKLKSQLQGGHQEKNIRPGTENVVSIVGFGKASQLYESKRSTESVSVQKLRDKLQEGLFQKLPSIHLNGHPKMRIYNTLNISFDGVDGETLLVNLDLEKIFVSTGSACTAGSVEASHVLLAMGLDEKRARSAIRFSLGRFTTDDQIEYVLDSLPRIVSRLRKSSTGAS